MNKISKKVLEFVGRAKEQFETTDTYSVINENEGLIAFKTGIHENHITVYEHCDKVAEFTGQLPERFTKIVNEVDYNKLVTKLNLIDEVLQSGMYDKCKLEDIQKIIDAQ